MGVNDDETLSALRRLQRDLQAPLRVQVLLGEISQMTRRNLLQLVMAAPALTLAAQDQTQEPDVQKKVQVMQLTKAIRDFHFTWMDFVTEYANSDDDFFNPVAASEVEGAFRKMISTPGWVSTKKV